MKSKKLFLIFIFGLFILLLPNFAEAACPLWCDCYIPDDCAYRTWDGSLNAFERLGLIGSVESLSTGRPHTSNCPSCEDSNGKCKGNAFLSGYNGQSCTARDGCWSWGCDYISATGKWDYSQSKCVSCNGYKEDRIWGDTSNVYFGCGSENGNAGNGKCESACGLSGDNATYCDEKSASAYTGGCGYSNTKRKDYCNSSCAVSDKECSSACGADSACDGKYPGDSCGGGVTCTSDCKCPSGCTIGGTTYANGTCNGKCQYCDISESTTAWSDVASGYICSGDAIYPVSSTYYCNYDENCDNGDCAATKWWTSCDGSGSCRSASDHTDSYFENVYASNGKVLKNNCSETSPSTSYYCNIYNDCNSGDCIGYKYYRACNGSGSCRTDNTYAYEKTIYASAGYSLTSACGTTGSTLCDSTWRASSGPGDNKYGDGGSDSCQGMCDGSGNCDYAVNCKGAPVFDFSISVSPTSGSVTQGDAINTTVNLDLVSGTSQSVTLSASDLPPGASVGFYSDGTTSNSCSPPCSRRMTIFTTADTPLGNYPNIKVTGTGGGKTHDTFYNLTVTAGGAAINPPSVTTNTATNVTQASATLNGTLNSLGYDPGTCSSCSCIVWFKWGPTTAMANSTPVQTMTSTGSFSANISGLTAGQTYYFEAFAKNGGSW